MANLIACNDLLKVRVNAFQNGGFAVFYPDNGLVSRKDFKDKDAALKFAKKTLKQLATLELV